MAIIFWAFSILLLSTSTSGRSGLECYVCASKECPIAKASDLVFKCNSPDSVPYCYTSFSPNNKAKHRHCTSTDMLKSEYNIIEVKTGCHEFPIGKICICNTSKCNTRGNFNESTRINMGGTWITILLAGVIVLLFIS